MPKLEIVDPWGFDKRYTFSPAVRKGNLLFISGMTATDDNGNIPVLIGDTITPELEVTALVPKIDMGLVRLTTRVTNQRGEIVLEGTYAYLIKKRSR